VAPGAEIARPQELLELDSSARPTPAHFSEQREQSWAPRPFGALRVPVLFVPVPVPVFSVPVPVFSVLVLSQVREPATLKPLRRARACW